MTENIKDCCLNIHHTKLWPQYICYTDLVALIQISHFLFNNCYFSYSVSAHSLPHPPLHDKELHVTVWQFLWCLEVPHTPSASITHTYTHPVLEYLSEVSWLGLRLGTALPNHIAASKSSVYISNYIVARRVLEHSGRSPFHLCAASNPPCLAYFSLSPHFSIFIYLFSSALSLLLFESTVHQATVLICPPISVLWTQHRRAEPTVGGSGIIFWWSVYCPAPICSGSQYNIHSSMHNMMDQSWVKDNSKEYCLQFGLQG